MLEITRGRTWIQHHTVLESETGPATDLSIFSSFKSQIREKTATKNAKGVFEHKLVAEVLVETSENVITQSLTAAQTTALVPGEYLIDMIGVREDSGAHESLMDPEVIGVRNRPTQP